MEPAQSVDVDRAVVHPDTLQQVGGSGRSLADERGLVDQIEYVAHFPKVLSVTCLRCQVIRLGDSRHAAEFPARGGGE